MMVTLLCFSDAWITRTSDLPLGVVSLSWKTCSRSPLAGPMPATVYAPPGVMCTLVDRTGGDDGLAPAPRMATVYSPGVTFSYGETAPYPTWCRTIMACELPNE